MPETRDKRGRFIELGEARVKKATEMLRLIGNLSNRSNYDYTPEDARLILSAVDAEVKLLRAKFQASQSLPARGKFTLKK